ncbi:MAG: histidine triad nucleotide-binding protein [Thermomicrobiaceae bacterium]|nr:histidine triad nucleotide-binding protein [Thermomicrobiaceae bacterium]
MAQDCIFCQIAAGKVPARVVYRDDGVTVFHDIQPQASTHLLVIPNQHVESLNEAEEVDPALLGRLLQVAARVAREAGIDRSGYRVVTNTGPDSGQTVYHLHLHVLGGNRLRLPLG